jgi:hypothetical protein
MLRWQQALSPGTCSLGCDGPLSLRQVNFVMRNRTLHLGLLLAVGGCDNAGPAAPFDAATLRDASGVTADASPTPVWTEAFPAAEFGWLLNVWGPAPDDLYAVGGLPNQGRVMHFDGQTWSALELRVSVPVLHWAHGFGADDVTIVGRGGTVIHWDGTAWTIQDTPTQQELWGVWGASPNAGQIGGMVDHFAPLRSSRASDGRRFLG